MGGATIPPLQVVHSIFGKEPTQGEFRSPHVFWQNTLGLSLSLSSCDFNAQIDPNAKLIYNDNKAEGAGLPGGQSRKANAMYDMLKGAVMICQ